MAKDNSNNNYGKVVNHHQLSLPHRENKFLCPTPSNLQYFNTSKLIIKFSNS